MFDLTVLQMVLSVISGLIVGFSLGLVGGGGSILAIPLLIYLVGFSNPHKAIGTTALAVSINAFLNLVPHARGKHVDFRKGFLFSIPGLAGVWIGAELGLLTPGRKLLFIFAILMIAIAVYMLKKKCVEAAVEPRHKGSILKLLSIGFLVGFLSGYFGIGGGFLIVPGLIYAGALNILQAVGTSLLSVGLFGLLTAVRYFMSGELNLFISALYIAGGVFGGWLGAYLASRLSRRLLTRIFAIVLIIVAIYMLYMNFSAIL
ncbi:sulfite exporter TauE/SafE family protein [Thermogladius sp. 4427co]|uniref:sulfite exporter TauE/SafE family protein n=1 Tax=Thermogladius sp. 4427co TaxID=3450718 RepID=UPI003F79A993